MLTSTPWSGASRAATDSSNGTTSWNADTIVETGPRSTRTVGAGSSALLQRESRRRLLEKIDLEALRGREHGARALREVFEKGCRPDATPPC